MPFSSHSSITAREFGCAVIDLKKNKLHERIFPMIHKSTFEELLNRNVCVSIDFQKLGMDISKFVKGLHPEIMNEVFQIY